MSIKEKRARRNISRFDRPKKSRLPTPVTVLGMGKAVPDYSICQKDAAELAKRLSCRTAKHERLLPVLYQRTRVGRRGSVLIDESANGNGGVRTNGNGNGHLPSVSFFPQMQFDGDQGPRTEQRMQRYALEAPRLAVKSSRRALRNAGVGAGQIGHLVTVSCTGFSTPGFDIALIKALGLSSGVSRTHIGFMGCHGLFNGFRVASALAREHPDKKVLLCSVELCSLHFAYGWDPDRVVTNALFADGSSAVVFSAGQKSVANGHRRRWDLLSTGSHLFPDSEDAMTWDIGDHGFSMTLSPRVPGLIGAHLYPWLTQWLKSHRLAMNDVRSWAIHPGGPRVLDAVEGALKLPVGTARASRKVLADYGNMSSSTILFILDQLFRERAPTPCLALGFGPGLVVEVALLL